MKSLVLMAVGVLAACGSGGGDPDASISPAEDSGIFSPPDASGVEVDAGPRPDAQASACGYSTEAREFSCGASDTMPGDVRCTGTTCCAGVCDPDLGSETCCDSATGIITRLDYSAGTCDESSETCTN